MRNILSVLFILFFVFGCSATHQNELKTKDFSDIKNIKNLTELNQLLPLKIDDDTILVSVFKKNENNKDVFVYSYRMINYEKGFIDIEQLQMNIHVSGCSKEIKQNDGAVATFSYSDKNSVYIGEFNFSKNTCLAIFYMYKNDANGFRKYIYSLSDDEFSNLKFRTTNNLLTKEFKAIYTQRTLDMKLFNTDLDLN